MADVVRDQTALPASRSSGPAGGTRRSEPPPVIETPLVQWLRTRFFGSWSSAVITLASLALLAYVLPGFFRWAFVDAVWYTKDHEVCRKAAGACWAVVAEKHRPMLFGVYPYEEHWRLVLALALYMGTILVTVQRRFWRAEILVPLWLVMVVAVGILLWGGVFGLTFVDTSQWGGLPLTMVLFTGTVVLGMPIAMLLALGRQSSLPLVKAVSVTIIESLRGVPLITILFVAVNVFPLFLPSGLELNKLLRVMVGMAIFFACYQAEVIRGGLQAIPKGQYEAAESLGLTYWHTTSRVILPQALRICLPGMVNHIIAALKNTSFVLIIGLFDILTATTAVMEDPVWRKFFVEAYLCVALIYFVFCFALSKYSQRLEGWLNEGRRT
ncbi:MAG: amino acid ABC transporter permease [Hyphomicrobiaceae bacterium]|nr:amino acid ABC transporter permease [Hyphomicrobiaceae bacterium]